MRPCSLTFMWAPPWYRFAHMLANLDVSGAAIQVSAQPALSPYYMALSLKLTECFVPPRRNPSVQQPNKLLWGTRKMFLSCVGSHVKVLLQFRGFLSLTARSAASIPFRWSNSATCNLHVRMVLIQAFCNSGRLWFPVNVAVATAPDVLLTLS